MIRTHCPLCGGKLAEYMPNKKECPIQEKFVSRNKELFDCHYRNSDDTAIGHFYEQFIVAPYKIESYDEDVFEVYKYTSRGVRFIVEVSGKDIFPWRDRAKTIQTLKTYTVMS